MDEHHENAARLALALRIAGEQWARALHAEGERDAERRAHEDTRWAWARATGEDQRDMDEARAKVAKLETERQAGIDALRRVMPARPAAGQPTSIATAAAEEIERLRGELAETETWGPLMLAANNEILRLRAKLAAVRALADPGGCGR